MTDELAVELLKEAGRTALMKFVTASRVHANKLDQAKELKKMVFFSNIVLSPLLEEAKGAEWMQRDREEEEKRAKAQKEIQEMVQEMQAKVARQQRRAREEGRTLEEIQKEEEEEEERAEAERKARAESGEEATTGEEGEKKEDAEVASEADKPKSLQKAEVSVAPTSARGTGGRWAWLASWPSAGSALDGSGSVVAC